MLAGPKKRRGSYKSHLLFSGFLQSSLHKSAAAAAQSSSTAATKLTFSSSSQQSTSS
ncbi:MAG: hypothetical protein MHMPM18_003190, partial [Marteilia pararefringens]